MCKLYSIHICTNLFILVYHLMVGDWMIKWTAIPNKGFPSFLTVLVDELKGLIIIFCKKSAREHLSQMLQGLTLTSQYHDAMCYGHQKSLWYLVSWCHFTGNICLNSSLSSGHVNFLLSSYPTSGTSNPVEIPSCQKIQMFPCMWT